MIALLAAVAGGLGAGARFVLDGVARARLTAALPLGTTAVNLSGSLALGLVAGLVVFQHAPSAALSVAGTGFLGGYTTFSTASFETVRLLQEGRRRAAAAHVAMNVVGSLGAAGLGLAVAAAW